METTTRSGRKRTTSAAEGLKVKNEGPKVKKRKKTSKHNSSQDVSTAVDSSPPSHTTPPEKDPGTEPDTYTSLITPPTKRNSKRTKLSKVAGTLTDHQAVSPSTAAVSVGKGSSPKKTTGLKASKSSESTSDKSGDDLRTSTSAPQVKKKKKGASKDTVGTSSSAVAMETTTESPVPPTVKPAVKTKNKRRTFYLKPVNGSWAKQMGSLLVYRCISQAVIHDIDPRDHLDDLNWSILGEGFLSAKDMKLIWFLIKREFPNKSLAEIRDELKPYTTLTVEEFVRADIKDKFKTELPKAPPTAYMLFSLSKGASLKAKYPDLVQTDIMRKLGSKWKSMSAEKQDKYKQQYQLLKKEYDSKLQAFYCEHPDAKTPKRVRRPGTIDGDLTPEERRVKELKAMMPKAPPKSYMLFCKAKRDKLHKRNPDLNSKEITLKLSKKWKSMGDSGQAKYKRTYEDMLRLHRERQRVFNETYPDAKETLARARKAKTVPVVTISTQTNILATPKADTPLARVASLLDKDDETDLSSSEESEGARLNVGAESDESSDDSSDEINVDSPPPLVQHKSSKPSVTRQSRDSSSSSSFDTDSDSD